MDTFSEFTRQVPIGLLLAPIFFGVCYVVVMFVVFRRASERRRKRRLANAGNTATSPTQFAVPSANLVIGQRADPERRPAAWSVPAALRDLPEPDLDMLVTPRLMTEPETIDSAINAMNLSDASTAPDMDWLALLPTASAIPQALQLEQKMEITMPTSTVPNTDYGRKPFDRATEPNDAVEVMRVWRDLSDGSLIIQMGDQRYRSLADVSSPDLARRFTAVVRELWSMVNNGAGGSSGTGRLTGGAAAPALAAPAESMGVPPPDNSAGGMKARVGMLNAAPDEESKPKPGLLRQVARTAMGQTPTPAPEVRRDGIGDAVEEYLQYRLSNNAQFQSRSVHIRPAIDSGVRIEVDGHYYDAVGDVIDADVREFLFSVLREWEARQ